MPPSFHDKIHANEWVGQITSLLSNSKGGGRAESAQIQGTINENNAEIGDVFVKFAQMKL